MKRDVKYIVVASGLLIGLTYYLIKHVADLDRSVTNFAVAYTAMFGYLAVTIFASLAMRPHVVAKDFDYDSVSIDVFVPVYNEDPALLAAGILSLTRQTRLPQAMWLVDDGSDTPVLDSTEVQSAVAVARRAGIAVHEHRQDNAGKRVAQTWGFEQSTADVYVTVDSDTVLADDAVEKILIPFGRADVMCVGGLAAGQNHTKSVLTRVIELGFVMAFLSGRMAEGYFGSVRVNCGILAAYRGNVVRENLGRYLTQKFLGQPVNIGDDRALTIYCKERGRAEFQPAAVAYSALPETLSHLVRQRTRWARSWYWGTLWLLRRKVNSADFLLTVAQCAGMACYLVTAVVAVVGISTGEIEPRLLGWAVVTSIAIGMTVSLRYVAWARPHDPLPSRLLTWLLSPLSSVLYMFLLVPLYWYAACTLRPKGWGTRQTVEVGLHSTSREMLDAA